MKKIIIATVLTLLIPLQANAISYKLFKKEADGNSANKTVAYASAFAMFDGMKIIIERFSKDKKDNFSCAIKTIQTLRKQDDDSAFRQLVVYMDEGYSSYLELLRKKEQNMSVHQIIQKANNIGVANYLAVGMHRRPECNKAKEEK